MTEPVLTRTAPLADLELRGSDGRTVVGLAVPFDVPTEIRDPMGSYVESFKRGAFARTLAERGAARVKLVAVHDYRKLPLGRLTQAVEDTAGLRIEARISATAAGDEALELVRDGALDSFSIGFAPVAGGDRWSRDRTSVERIEVRLHEVSLVPFPAYETALIAGVRHAAPGPHISDPLARLDALARPVVADFTIDAEALARRFRTLTETR